jgi:hypothetical protein
VQRFRNQFAQKLDHTVESNTVEIIGLYQFWRKVLVMRCLASCWVQIRMDIFTNFTVIVFLLVAIWFSNNGWITLGLLGLIANSSVSVSLFKRV